MAGAGKPKTGGRKKGTPNKASADLLQLIRDHVGVQEYHPVLAMAEIANDVDMSIETRTAMHKEVARYDSPQLKAIEHTAGEEGLGLNLHLNLGPRPKKGNGARS